MPIATKTGFSRPTMQELIDRINGDLNASIAEGEAALTPGALRGLRLFTPIWATVLAGGWYMIYKYMDYGLDQFFIQYAKGTILDIHAKIWGLSRKAATRAVRTVRFRGNPGTVVPVDRLVTRTDGFQYKVSAGATPWTVGSDSQLDVPIRAVTPGTQGNGVVGEPLTLARPIAGLESAVTTVATNNDTAGANEESDEELRARILFRIAWPPCGGAPHDYVRWATEATSVMKAWCLRAHPRPGFVTVLFANREGSSFREEETPNNPIPNGGGAYKLPLTDVGEDEAGHYVTIPKAQVATKLGRTPAVGWFRYGALIHDIDNGLGHATTELSGTGLVDAGSNWKVYLAAEPEKQILDTEAVHLLCEHTKEVYAAIHQRDDAGWQDRKPSEATCYVTFPTPVSVQLQATLSAADPEAFARLAAAEIAAVLTDKGGPEGTVKNWDLHEALANTPGHTGHTIADIVVHGVHLGALADITLDKTHIAVFDGFLS